MKKVIFGLSECDENYGNLEGERGRERENEWN